jgi:DNA-binding MltR family transcriptional regulator
MSETPHTGPDPVVVRNWFNMHELWTKGHAGQALLTAAILDRELTTLILKKMRPLSKTKHERLFETIGAPLAEFANKIEMAYALAQIDEDTHAKLKIIKDIRNKFAHLPKECTFWTGEISALIDKFQSTEKATQPQIFGQMAEICFTRPKAANAAPAPSPDTAL